MAKYTLLELTQTILSSMDSDEITSITDTVESQQVVKVIKTAYYGLINRGSLPENYSIVSLTETDANSPTLMSVPTTVSEIKWIKYNNATTTNTDVNMVLVDYLPLDQFLDRMDSLTESDSNIDSFTYTDADTNQSFKILCWNDRFPQYYTSYNDNILIFDAYNGDDTADTYLTSAKTRAYAKFIVVWSDSDVFSLTLDEPQYDLLLNEAKSLAWAELRQSPHPKAEQSARRGWTYTQKHKNKTETLSDFDKLPYFGRR